MFDVSDMRPVVQTQLERVIDFLKDSSAHTGPGSVPQLTTIRQPEFYNTRVSNQPPKDRDYGFYHEWPKHEFHFTDDFLAGWQGYFRSKAHEDLRRLTLYANTSEGQRHLRTLEEEMLASIQMFFLHEFLHVDQHLTSYQHAEIEKAPSVLRLVDYHADAIPVLATQRRYEHNREQGLLGSPSSAIGMLARLIRATLWGIESFQFAGPKKVTNLGIGQFMRYVTWHYQLHRVRAFKPDLHIRDVQLDVLPTIDIRGLRSWEFKENVVTETPVSFLKQGDYDPPFLWVGAPNAHGLAKVYRLWPTDPAKKIPLFFKGILSADADSTEPIFAELFCEHRALIGYEQQPPLSVVRNGDILPRSASAEVAQIMRDLAEVLLRIQIVPTDFVERLTMLNRIGVLREPEYLRVSRESFAFALLNDLVNRGQVTSLSNLELISIHNCDDQVKQRLMAMFAVTKRQATSPTP
jgi:hypothetical protein